MPTKNLHLQQTKFLATVNSEYRDDEIAYDYIGHIACCDRRENTAV
jgi:hypothetical protein